MSDNKPTIEEIVLFWLDSYDSRIPVKEGPEKRRAFLELAETFKKYGYDESDLPESKRLDIVSECVPENWPTKEARTWRKLHKKNLDQAIISVFKKIELAEVNETQIFPVRSPLQEETRPESTLDAPSLAPELDRSIFKDLPESSPILEEEFLKDLGLEDDE